MYESEQLFPIRAHEDRNDRRVIYVALIVSIVLHFLALVLLNYERLFGASEAPQTNEPPPLELVFEQPEREIAKSLPDQFYELVENPHASGEAPDVSNRLSTEDSRSRSPEITAGELRAIPGSDVTEQQEAAAQQQENTEKLLPEAVQNAMLAFRESRTFNKSALTGKEQKKESEEKQTEEQRGESFQKASNFKAEEVGDFALSTYAWSWAPYWLEFKRKLYRVWLTPPAYYQLGLIHGYTIVHFKVTREGQLRDLEVLRHVGHESLMESSVSAIESSFPLAPLPSDFPDEFLEVSIKMIYPDLRQYQQVSN
ncbi:MAG: hypothetical protein Kow0042_11390 [Calditrichia bacterium]